MRFGFVLPGGTAPDQIECAVLAEQSGWDGVFVWEASYAIDPWSLLSAISQQTERVRLGTMLTPLPWRRPWKLAGQVATLDVLSGGRAVLAVGLGAVDTGLGTVGQVTDRRTRAELLDEGIDLIAALWEGDGRYEGKHYRIDMTTAGALGEPLRTVQKPRVPIWVVGGWPRPRSMRRVLRCDGIMPNIFGDGGEMREAKPQDLVDIVEWLDANGGRRPGFDVIWEGETPADDAARATEIVKPWADAGATWWMETRWMMAGDDAEDPGRVVRERIAAGPPKL